MAGVIRVSRLVLGDGLALDLGRFAHTQQKRCAQPDAVGRGGTRTVLTPRQHRQGREGRKALHDASQLHFPSH
jgi:hypothetical protein